MTLPERHLAAVEVHRPLDSDRLARLHQRALAFASHRRADNTLRAYRSDLKHFGAWGVEVGLQVLPAAPATVALYLTELAEWASPSTIARRVAAINAVHEAAGLESPTKDPFVRDVHGGIRRSRPTRGRGKDALLRDDIIAIVDAMEPGLATTRDKALVLTMFVTACRREEVAKLEVADLSWHTAGVVALVRTSKADQEGAGREVAVPRSTDPRYCPVLALDEWLSTAAITSASVFRGINRWGTVAERALTGHSIARIIQMRARQAGLGHLDVGAHSTRVGFVTQSSKTASEASIATQTGHQSIKVLRGYRRHARIFEDTAASALGL